MGDWLRKNNNRIDYGGRKYQFKAGQTLIIDGSKHSIEGLQNQIDIKNDVLTIRFSSDVHKVKSFNNIYNSRFPTYKKGQVRRLEDVIIELGMDRIFNIEQNREHLIDELLK